MATWYGTNYTLERITRPPGKIPPGDSGGRLKCAYDEITFTQDVIADDDEILLMKIPKGARLHEVVVKADNLGSTGTFNVGIMANTDDYAADDEDAIMSGVNVAGQEDVQRMTDAIGALAQFQKFTAEAQVYIKMSAATDGASGDKIRVAAYYTMD